MKNKMIITLTILSFSLFSKASVYEISDKGQRCKLACQHLYGKFENNQCSCSSSPSGKTDFFIVFPEEKSSVNTK